jgi:hypothetical protein
MRQEDHAKPDAKLVQRISKSASIILKAPIQTVFPLFGPIQEQLWADGWEPEILYETPEVEMHMIFRTKSAFPDEAFYTWAITHYSTVDWKIEYTVYAVDRIWFITVVCEPMSSETRAYVTYAYTGFTPEAQHKNQESLKRMFADDLRDWEEAINHYLKTGKKLTQKP